MISMKPLEARYTAAFANTEIDIDRLGMFFTKTLQIPNVSYDDVVKELKTIKGTEATPSLESIRNLYQLLDHFCQTDPASTIVEQLRQGWLLSRTNL